MSKTKIVKTFTGQSVLDFVQNLPALEELNSKKHMHCHQPFDFYEIAELHKTLVAKSE